MRYWHRFRKTRIPESESLFSLAKLGFAHVDICPKMLRSSGARSALADLGMDVCCLSLSHEAPPNSAFDSDDDKWVDPIENHTRQGIEHAAQLGASCAYVVPPKPKDQNTLPILSQRYKQLAELGRSKGIKIAIEHFPGTVLPTVRSTLKFIEKVGHPNLYLLFDIGHAQMSNEDPADVLPIAGDRLAYIHLDDNDGQGPGERGFDPSLSAGMGDEQEEGADPRAGHRQARAPSARVHDQDAGRQGEARGRDPQGRAALEEERVLSVEVHVAPLRAAVPRCALRRTPGQRGR